jgi:hypothetical protein
MKRERSLRAARAALALAIGIALCGCELGPIGRSALRGERSGVPLSDFSSLEPRYALDIQTHARSWLPAARAWFIVQDGVLWLYAMSNPDLEYPWLRRLRDEQPGLTIGVDGRLYEARATLVTDAATLDPLLPRVLRKYHGIATARARFLPQSAAQPGTQIRHWFFRVEPGAGASR